MVQPQSPSPPAGSLPLSTCKSFRSNRTNSKKSNGSAGTSKWSGPSSPGSDIWGIQLVSRAYRDVPYAPVDPWKPSLMYSIRHIIPEASSLPGTPTSSAPLDNNSIGVHSPLVTPEIHELVDYPFSPHDPHISTTMPLRYPHKHHAVNHYISELSRSRTVDYRSSYPEAGSARLSHEGRHSWPYPSPTRGPTSANYNHLDRAPWHRDNFDVEKPSQGNLPTQGNTEHLRISDPRSFAFPLPRLPVPMVGTHSRGTSGSQTIVSGVQRPPPAAPFDHHTAQLQNENTIDSGTTLLISSNHNYLRPTPILGRPPGPRLRPGFTPQGQNSNGSPLSKSVGPKSTNTKETQNVFSTRTYIIAFVLDTLPRQIYLYFLLCLPSMYFSRVAHIFEAAELSLPKIKQGVIEHATQSEQHRHITTSHNWRFGPPAPNAAYLNLQKTWELFIESLMREWRTLNIVSVLLLSYVLHFIIL